ncbi:F-box domain-containing protein [Orpheovirus IHUMI-LCC2]|uniref:F-box domain-containing protein n=1 Tax=Orpheovirus IHUMI-LCC2 TaxID=2023057 RepID=A0A2I2L4W6_9VIRU|nr:F-box domain-containing protein [Orpheovirus IHUMI-LCC2]SNW62588.1 F-box domain-containing protein [Orpheovirus IHUMI-LCC2]
MFNDLPREIIEEIVIYLKREELYNISLLNMRLYKILHGEDFLNKKLQNGYGNIYYYDITFHLEVERR